MARRQPHLGPDPDGGPGTPSPPRTYWGYVPLLSKRLNRISSTRWYSRSMSAPSSPRWSGRKKRPPQLAPGVPAPGIPGRPVRRPVDPRAAAGLGGAGAARGSGRAPRRPGRGIGGPGPRRPDGGRPTRSGRRPRGRRAHCRSRRRSGPPPGPASPRGASSMRSPRSRPLEAACGAGPRRHTMRPARAGRLVTRGGGAMLLKRFHDAAIELMKLERRVDPFFRPALDALLREPLAALVQALINLRRRNEGLRIAEESPCPARRPSSTRSSRTWPPTCACTTRRASSSARGTPRRTASFAASSSCETTCRPSGAAASSPSRGPSAPGCGSPAPGPPARPTSRRWAS